MSEESSSRSEESDEDSAESSFGLDNVRDNKDKAALIAKTRGSLEQSNIPRILTKAEASKCLYALGKCYDGTSYAYLAIDVSNRNLTDVSVVATFRYLLRANVSGNRLSLEALAALTSMPFLLMLEADDNDLSSADLKSMGQLQVLSLNRNSLQDISKISHPLVESLELNYNRISEIDLNPYVLKNLKNLQMRGNKISKIDSLNFSSLVRLYLAENEIGSLNDLGNLVSLEILHLRDNRLESLDGFTPNCAQLKYLNIRKNSISLMSEIKKLTCLPALETLVVSENPVITWDEAEEEERDDEQDNYRITVFALLPGLKRLNKDSITKEERREAEHLRRQWREENRNL